jgi:hypothetical protein
VREVGETSRQYATVIEYDSPIRNIFDCHDLTVDELSSCLGVAIGSNQ